MVHLHFLLGQRVQSERAGDFSAHPTDVNISNRAYSLHLGHPGQGHHCKLQRSPSLL